MSKYVIDASVAAKWLFLEPGSEYAKLLLSQFEHFYAPSLFEIELDSIITKRCREKEINREEAWQKKEEAQKLPVHYIDYTDISEAAIEISITLPVTVYDAAYIATAVHVKGILYTADERLVRGIESTPLERFVQSINSL